MSKDGKTDGVGGPDRASMRERAYRLARASGCSSRGRSCT